MSDQGLSRAMKACLVLEDALQLFVRKEMSAEDFDRCIAASDLITKNLSKEIRDIKKLAAQEGGA
jgi:glutaredoxin 2